MTKRSGVVEALCWRGLYSDADSRERWAVFLTLAIMCISITFTNFAIVGFEYTYGRMFHVINAILPIAITAMLLGTRRASIVGFIAGIALLLHAKASPSNFYEWALVGVPTSVVLFPICGIAFGALFGLQASRQTSRAKRFVFILLSCLAVSALCTLSFYGYFRFLRASERISESALQYGQTLNDVSGTSFVPRLGIRMLESLVQMGVDTLIWCLAGSVVSVFARRVTAKRDGMRVRTLFSIWLTNGIFVVYLIASVMCFVMVTNHLFDAAEADMKSEVNYLYLQTKLLEERAESFRDFYHSLNIEYDDMTSEQQQAISSMLDHYNGLLDGYTIEQTGLVVITINDKVFMSDSELFPVGEKLQDLVDETMMHTITRSCETDGMLRAYFNGTTVEPDKAVEQNRQAQIAYVLSENYNSYRIIIIKPANMVFETRNPVMLEVYAITGAIALIVFVVVSRLLNEVIATRIDDLDSTMGRITSGDLKARAEVTGAYEFRTLSTNLNKTVDVLKDLINEAETRMDSELASAKAIQEAALPHTFPPFPKIDAFDVFASMDPAKKVGGDFYDFFLIGDSGPKNGKLGFVLADVSGKGVPAALFMMKAKALIRENIEGGTPLEDAIQHANAKLCEGNDACMFVTAWIGVLDYRNHAIEYVNAGHNPPLLWRANTGWEWMPEASGPPLGLVDMPYAVESLACEVGDTLLLYTDGVTEAEDPEVEQYGDARLKALVDTMEDPQAQELVQTVRADVVKFVKGSVQSDDLTMLALKIR